MHNKYIKSSAHFQAITLRQLHSLPHHAADLIAKPPLRALAAVNNFDEDREMNEEESKREEAEAMPA